MEQYLNLIWKNYTASLSQNSNENFFDEQDDASDLFTDNDLHYKIPFWIGVIVISLFFLSAIVATLRYCFYNLCSSHTENEKVALMPPTSPCLSSNVTNTIQRQRHKISDPLSHHTFNDNETISSSHEQLRDHHSNISILPIIRQYSRSYLTHAQQQHTEIDIDNMNNHYFSPTQMKSSRASVDFRKKTHDIYVLPVSPALSSSSSTANTNERIRTGSNSMPIRSRRHLLSSINIQNDSTYHGIKNDCFTDSPKPKDRTLPRSHAGTLRHIQPPTQPPPLPPIISQLQFNNDGKLSFQHHSTTVDLDPDIIVQNFNTIEENQMKKAPPVPFRSQKPSELSVSFEELKKQTDKIDLQLLIKSSPQDDHSEHTWPKPPESMSTSETNRSSSISYDHLNHDHIIPTVIMRQTNTTDVFHQYHHDEHFMLTESDT